MRQSSRNCPEWLSHSGAHFELSLNPVFDKASLID